MKSQPNFIARIPRPYQILGGAIIVIVLAFVCYHLFHGSANASTARTRPASEQVTVASVQSLSPNNAPLSVIGQVTSEDEATVLSQTSGEIVNVDKQLGDQVYAGETIATFENSSEQASVLQEQGTYNAAFANLTQASGVTAVNSSINSTQASQTATTAQTSAIAALQSGYAALDNAVDSDADQFFTSPQSADPLLIDYFNAIPDENTVTPQFLTTIDNERLALEATLANDATLSSATTSVQITANMQTMIADAQTVNTFLNNLAEAVNLLPVNPDLSAATIASYQTTMSDARSEVTTAISNLTAAMNTFGSDEATASTEANSANGGSNSTIAAAQAQVQEALGEYDAAKSALAKTIVTSPIDGTIIALPVTSGDYVPSFSEVAEVSNPGALKVVTYVTADDAATLAVGNTAAVNGAIQGVITSIAPAIDPQTGTIEVDIGLPAGQTGLVDQDSVTVDLNRSVSAAAAADESVSSTTSNIIPIVALKITPTGPVVFTVQAGSGIGRSNTTGDGGTASFIASSTTARSPISTLVSHPVSIGSILGDDIVVTSGLTPDMMIVTDARGLTDGELVTVAPSAANPSDSSSQEPDTTTQ